MQEDLPFFRWIRQRSDLYTYLISVSVPVDQHVAEKETDKVDK